MSATNSIQSFESVPAASRLATPFPSQAPTSILNRRTTKHEHHKPQNLKMASIYPFKLNPLAVPFQVAVDKESQVKIDNLTNPSEGELESFRLFDYKLTLLSYQIQ